MRNADPKYMHIQDAMAGDAAAVQKLLEAWLPDILGWCARLGDPRVIPEDAAMDVCVVVWQRVRHLSCPERFPSWIFAVTRRTLLHHQGRVWVNRWVSRVMDGIPDPSRGPEAAVDVDRVRRALRRVPWRQREALILVYVEERSISEVASLLGVPPTTVKGRLRCGRLRFREAAALLGLLDGEDVLGPAVEDLGEEVCP